MCTEASDLLKFRQPAHGHGLTCGLLKDQNALIPQQSSNVRVSVQGVESLWGDCRFILADWGS